MKQQKHSRHHMKAVKDVNLQTEKKLQDKVSWLVMKGVLS